jgi:hypothetical protein
VTNDGGTYCQAPKLKPGWQLWLGNAWVTITSVRIAGKDILIRTDDGRTYRAGYLDAVRCRRAPPAA